MKLWEFAAWIGGLLGPLALAVQIYNWFYNRKNRSKTP